MSNYVVSDTNLTAVADAIRTKGGTSDALAFPDGFVSAVEAIETGGSGGVQSGTFAVASDISVTASGITLPVGFSGQPDWIYCWMDKDSFAGLGTWSNNRWYRWALSKNDTEAMQSFPPIRVSASADAQTNYASAPYVLMIGSGVLQSTDTNNTVGYAIATMGYVTGNVTKHSVNADGTLTLARYSSAASIIPAGTYHYIAAQGISMYQA